LNISFTKLRNLFFAIIIVVQGPQAFSPVSTPALLDSAKVYLMTQNYAKARRMVDAALLKRPDIQEAHYLKCAIMQTEMLDYESYAEEGEVFLKHADSVSKMLSFRLPLETGKDSIKCLFFLGSTLGGIGIIQSKLGNVPFGARNAMASIGYYKQVIKLDPEFKAAYLGIGVFNYYLSESLRWVPFFVDKRQEAMEQLQLATQAPFPYNYAASNSFCWILIAQGNFQKADSLASHVLLRYPDNTMFVRAKVRIALACRQWDASIEQARRLIGLSTKRDPINWSDICSGYQAMLLAFDKLGMKKECKDTSEKALSMVVPERIRKIQNVRKQLKFIAEIHEKYEIKKQK
jgi:tetratricopeptide (TPR) repeat protein